MLKKRSEPGSLDEARREAEDCRACPLWKNATQTVFGEGSPHAPVMLVGEQPGDREDLAGRPFVGPAGKMLDRALLDAGIDRAKIYVTNAVKHFKWEPRGKRRIHKKPRMSEIKACRPWLEAELHALRPAVVVCLGATAAQSVLGAQFKLTQHHGEILPSPLSDVRWVVATLHPSAVLRAPDSEGRRAAFARLVDDLRAVAGALRA